jgi:hypothetical protein
MRLRITTMSPLSRETLEAISSYAEWLGAVFGILAATSAVVYVLVNRPLRKLDAHDNAVLQEKNTTAQTELAKAQLELGKFVNERTLPRSLNQHWEGYLKGKPTGTVALWYHPGDQEAYTLAFTIRHSLLGLGWKASEPVPIPANLMGDADISPNAPPAIRFGSIGVGNTVLRVRKVRPMIIGENTAEAALRDALLFGVNGSTGGAITPDPNLPEGHFTLMVLQK